jgi:hypothetical protein
LYTKLAGRHEVSEIVSRRNVRVWMWKLLTAKPLSDKEPSKILGLPFPDEFSFSIG